MDAAAMFPYVVPEAYLEFQAMEPEGLVRPLGHGLHVVLVVESGEMVRSVLPEELTASGLTPARAHARAVENLDGLARAGGLGMQRFEGAASTGPFVLVGGHWAAATSILLPGWPQFAREALACDAPVASIPHRDAMLVFGDGDAARRGAIRRFVEEMESDGAKPLTFELFALGRDGVRAI